MEVILNQTIEKLGKMGDLVKVKEGYGRNYLLPRSLAIIANKQNRQKIEALQKQQKLKEEKEHAEMISLSEQLSQVPCVIEVKVGEDDKLFGSVTSQNLAKIFKEAGFKVDKKQFLLEYPLKTVGEHDVEIKLSPQVIAKIKVTLVGKKD